MFDIIPPAKPVHGAAARLSLWDEAAGPSRRAANGSSAQQSTTPPALFNDFMPEQSTPPPPLFPEAFGAGGLTARLGGMMDGLSFAGGGGGGARSLLMTGLGGVWEGSREGNTVGFSAAPPSLELRDIAVPKPLATPPPRQPGLRHPQDDRWPGSGPAASGPERPAAAPDDGSDGDRQLEQQLVDALGIGSVSRVVALLP